MNDVRVDLQLRLDNVSNQAMEIRTKGAEIYTDIQGIDVIYEDMKDSSARYDNLIKEVQDFEDPKFLYQTIVLVVDVLAIACGFLGYFFHKRWITWIGHLILLLSCVFFFMVLAFEAAYMVVGIDFW
ncbi:MAG: hypothetical protein MJ252_22990 [archaeon]|nr:hypothetical protein [archaeon]